MHAIRIDRGKRLRDDPLCGHNRYRPDIAPVVENAEGEEIAWKRAMRSTARGPGHLMRVHHTRGTLQSSARHSSDASQSPAFGRPCRRSAPSDNEAVQLTGGLIGLGDGIRFFEGCHAFRRPAGLDGAARGDAQRDRRHASVVRHIGDDDNVILTETPRPSKTRRCRLPGTCRSACLTSLVIVHPVSRAPILTVSQ
jgi:hypothetical protein